MLQGTTPMERMIMAAMQKVAPDILQHFWGKCSEDERMQPVLNKKSLLQALMDAKGPEVVLGLSEHIPENSMSASILYLMLNSATPVELLKKVNRYDKFFHPNRRLELCDHSRDFVVVENVADSDDKPSAAEDLFVCGGIKNMLVRCGCKGLGVEWLSVCSGDVSQVLMTMGIPEPPVASHTRWRFSWREFIHSGHIAGLDEFLINYAEPFIKPNKMSVTDMVERVLLIDLSAKPSMEVIADMLGMSVRQFQRKMREEGTTYSRLFNDLRIKVASRMLRQSETSVTEIGFFCGFRDSCHFSREFKKAQQMSPRKYRELFREYTLPEDTE